ncbi:hypothetical protein KCP78_07965 [Salmonella enterica subsp. enterica]|nr:hypothetical protein KCP78_07965 [Salmonella enterica subsp. enterica]
MVLQTAKALRGARFQRHSSTGLNCSRWCVPMVDTPTVGDGTMSNAFSSAGAGRSLMTPVSR